jgi:exodeoxyribonuclease V beta subunit
MTPLDSLTFPLQGPSLIEASAGTGKTYTIVNLYLRLLLGHGCQPLSVEKILVVTFTKAATGELKERVRQKLRAAYLDFYSGSSKDSFVQALIDASEDITLDVKRLDLAAKQMDEAAIYTIHSFCQRMLTQHAFESGALYEQSLIMDESEWLSLAVSDYWRKYIVTLPPALLGEVYCHWPSPVALEKSLSPFKSRTVFSPSKITVEHSIEVFEHYQNAVVEIKRWWVDNDIGLLLGSAKLKKNTILGRPETFEKMHRFCQSEALVPDISKDGWGAFSSEKIEKAKTKGSPDLHNIDLSRFERMDSMYINASQNIKLAFSLHSLAIVRNNLASNKRLLNLLSPDDLLEQLNSALNEKSSSILDQTINQMFPAALIDEFQDTDPTQFSIFQQIYGSDENTDGQCWIMIGDPKQAIYAFRGADIFTYIQAKELVPKSQQFTLAYNWRSRPSLVDSINRLFGSSETGFLFDNLIPFNPVEAAKTDDSVILSGDTALPSMRFEFLQIDDEKPIQWNMSQHLLATNTANQIGRMLNNPTLIEGRQLAAGDCCVLVRDRNEAGVIKATLTNAGIASVFLERRSVFSTQTGFDLYLLLRAVANPSEERFIKAAFASELFAMTALEFDQLFYDEAAWQALVECCYQWQLIWQQQNVMLMLSQLFTHFSTHEKLVSHYQDGLRRVTDLRHLTELVQLQSALTPTESQILHWYSERISAPDNDNEAQQLRLETDANLVQIITMHASKGLEFPIVFVPFACRYRETKEAVYHDEQQRLTVDYLLNSSNLAVARRERLAEDIRLLYVAITRAVYHCSVGIWNNAHSTRKSDPDILNTALGSLLFSDLVEINNQSLHARLLEIVNHSDIAINAFDDAIVLAKYPVASPEQGAILEAKSLSTPIYRDWKLTSYSAISRQQQHELHDKPGTDETHLAIQSAEPLQSPSMSKFSFVKGAQAGSFLHGVLENINFQNPDNMKEVIEQQGQWYGIEAIWNDIVESWLHDVLKTPITHTSCKQPFTLQDLSKSDVLIEMEFHLPLVHVFETAFNTLINRYAPQNVRCYQFHELNGMLKGFIDLTVHYQGRYFVVDYKSNYLGDSEDDYQSSKLHRAMDEHDYHLQLILYTLALHRWLTVRLPDYQYDTHVGGAYYLFLRGMNQHIPGNGIYFSLPDKRLIEELDELFSNQHKLAKSKLAVIEQMGLWDE